MAKIKLCKKLNSEQLPKFKNTKSEYEGRSEVEYQVEIPLEELSMYVEDEYEEYGSKAYITNDLQPQLDRMTDGLFTSLYRNHVIKGYVRYERYHRPIFRFQVYSRENADSHECPEDYIEDVFLVPEEIENVLDVIDQYLVVSGGSADPQRTTKDDRIQAVTKELAPDLIMGMSRKAIEGIMAVIGNEYAQYIVERYKTANTDEIHERDLMAAIWTVLVNHFQSQ